MNSYCIFSTLLYSKSKTIVTCLMVSKSINNLHTEYLWKLVSDNHYGNIYKYEELYAMIDKSIYEKYKICYGINKVIKILQLQTYFSRIGFVNESIYDVYNKDDLRSFTKINKIPDEVKFLINLKTIEFNYGYLEEIPRELSCLKQLTSLTITEQLCSRIPKEIYKLKNLKLLSLIQNYFKKIPKKICKLKKLENIDLSNNLLKSVPSEIGRLKNLEYLTLNNNRLKNIPSELGNLEKLRLLNLSCNKFLTLLPSELGNIESLKNLRLENNKKILIPKEIGHPVKKHDVIYPINHSTLAKQSRFNLHINLYNKERKINVFI